MTIDSHGVTTDSTQSVIYATPQTLHESGFLETLRTDAAGYERQLDTLNTSSESASTPIDALREVLDEFEMQRPETLTPIIQELERRNERFKHEEMVQRRKEATEAFLEAIHAAFAEVAAKIDIDVAEFERQCVDPVTVVIELPEETRDALRRELKRCYRMHGGDLGDIPDRPSLQTLVNHCVRALQRSPAE